MHPARIVVHHQFEVVPLVLGEWICLINVITLAGFGVVPVDHEHFIIGLCIKAVRYGVWYASILRDFDPGV